MNSLVSSGIQRSSVAAAFALAVVALCLTDAEAQNPPGSAPKIPKVTPKKPQPMPKVPQPIPNPPAPFPRGPDPFVQQLDAIRWQLGPCVATIGNNLAQVQVPAGFKFTGREGTVAFLELTQNPSSPRDLGTLIPNGWPGNGDWFLTFEWDGVGYVKDDEKNDLDADALLASMRAGQTADNNVRIQKGWPTLTLVGWKQAPFYDPNTNNLTWATLVRELGRGGQGNLDTVNYNTRVLGRTGVMSVNLVIAPERLDGALPNYREILQGFSYLQGQRYSEFRAGDKVATYGLAALVTGGVVGLAAKSGWLAKFGKFIIVIVVAIGGGIAAVFRKLFGRKDYSAS